MKTVAQDATAARHPFRIPIGDWSDDGHGKCDWYDATAAKPVEAAREAYFAAMKKLPKLSPESFCEAYGDREIPGDTANLLRAAGAPLPENPDDFGTKDMAAIVVWFLNQGDGALDARLDGAEPPMLPFYGSDKKKRHIGGFGYGLLGE